MHARAWFLGPRLDVRKLERDSVATAPLVIRPNGDGYAVLFRFGAAVFFGVDPEGEKEFVRSVHAFVSDHFADVEVEDAEVRVDDDALERIAADGAIVLKEASVERLQAVAHVLAKSTVLAHYEARVAAAFDRVEVLAENLTHGKIPTRRKALLGEIGDVLLTHARTVGRAEVTEKPEITWDRPELDHLYERLAAEYELRDRDLALSRKLDLISGTAEMYLNLLQNRQGIRVEWYIVALIFFEIVLIVYDIFLVR